MPPMAITTSSIVQRPHSTLPRPPSARPQTAASTRDGACGSWVIAVIEARGVAREVGIAALDRETGNAVLIQLADCQTYVKTIHHIHLHSPAVILVPDTFVSEATSNRKPSLLIQSLREEFEDVAVEQVSRKYWNDSAGLDFVTQLIVNDDERPGTLLALANRYYALSAASALFKYADTRLNVIYANQSLRIRYRGVEGTMMVDTDTATNLELVANKTNKKSNHSLFGLLNHCFSPMGARLLRVNILAPITIQTSIDSRLDTVEELINAEDKYDGIKDALKTLRRIDLDKLIASLTTSESRPTKTTQVASARVSQMLDLRNVIRSLPAIRVALQGCRTRLLCVIRDMVSDERITRIDHLIAESLNEDATTTKATAGLASVNNRIYAVRANYDRLLDVARETYKENVGDILDLSQKLSDDHEMTITPMYIESAGGFWLTVRKDEVDGELPKEFINVTSKGAKYKFTTLELKKRNSRLKDSADETLLMSDRIIQGLVSEIIEDIGVLYKASEAIALLDMLWSFTHASILHSYVRPEFTGTLAIKGGRHPVFENVLAAGVFVPNDTYICDASTFQIIHGPNMSGKSTYLRQIGVMTIMAMCGCFVPAEYASFRVHDALLSRLSNDDDPERSLSTFSNEMASTAMILSLATGSSLILIDELGRGTSPMEGVGICHAIAEELIRRKSFVLFATHFSDLSITLSRYPLVVNLHLAVQANARSKGFGLNFRYRLMDGNSQNIPHYGLELAKLADLPTEVLSEARKAAEKLAGLEEERRQASRSTKLLIRRKAMVTLKTQLTQALAHSTLPDDALADYLLSLQKEIVGVLADTADDKVISGATDSDSDVSLACT